MKNISSLIGVMVLLVLTPAYSMQIVSPTSAVTWCRGETVSIDWTFNVTPQGPCTVTLMQGKSAVALIASDLPISQSHVDWKIPLKIAEGWYQISVSMADSDRFATSAKFQIRDCSRLPDRLPQGPGSLTPVPRIDVAVGDLYLTKNGRLWIKYINLSDKAIDVTVWEEVYVGDSKIYAGRIRLNMSKGGFRAHEVGFTCMSTPPLKKSIQVKGIIDARSELTEVNEANNTLIKVLTCPQGMGK